MEMKPDKEITRKSKTNFLYSFSLLPKEKNEAVNTVYAFCRKTDDIVDDEKISSESRFSNLREWREEFKRSLKDESKFKLLNRVSRVIKKFNIPAEPFLLLIDGMELDLKKKRYATFAELYAYCYSVASTVGLMCIEIFGYKKPETKEFAVNLGIAMQLTNILRDIKSDSERGRIYLPLEDLNKFDYSEEELISGIYNKNFYDLMKYEAERAKYYYEKANSYLTKEDKGLMFSARIMQHIYFRILKKIERNNYNVFSGKMRISKLKKLFITFGVYFKYKLLYDFPKSDTAGHRDNRLALNGE
jgi:phytoene synthase